MLVGIGESSMPTTSRSSFAAPSYNPSSFESTERPIMTPSLKPDDKKFQLPKPTGKGKASRNSQRSN